MPCNRSNNAADAQRAAEIASPLLFVTRTASSMRAINSSRAPLSPPRVPGALPGREVDRHRRREAAGNLLGSNKDNVPNVR